MKVTELRVGNKVSRNGIVVTIDARSIFDIWESSPEYKPIPLTEEWLKKFGFEKTETMGLKGCSFELTTPGDYEDEVYHQGQLWFDNETINIEFDNENGEYASINFRKIKFVHQLQNLYFSLTGEELKLKQ